ncbi:MAG: glycosyltransferase family 4 protein [Deltaproteobacteria bacterium]|nr:glycosyltransferase family 4 protein [Deltaproteobacteria bacterium]MBW2661990.1 glycosyltransferase family 4 protein [Deltaproteobacteria bacterium]
MNVSLIVDSLASAGGQRKCVNLAIGLKALGHNIQVLYYHGYHDLRPALQRSDIGGSYVSIPAGVVRRIFFVPYFLFQIKKTQPDVLIAFLDSSSILASLYRVFQRQCIIIHSHGSARFFPPRDKFYLAFERYFGFLHDFCVTNSYEMWAYLKDHGCDVKKVCVIKNGIDTELFSQNRSKGNKTAQKSNHIKFVMVSHYSVEKNQRLVVDAVNRLSTAEQKMLKIKCIGAISDSKYYESLLSYIEESGLSDIISFSGPINDVPKFLVSGDWFLHPSLYEGLPNAVLEAMACELPIIVSDYPSTKRLVDNDVNGYWFKNGSLKSLVAVLRRALKIPQDIRYKMGNEGRKMVEKHYNLLAMARNFEELFHKT